VNSSHSQLINQDRRFPLFVSFERSWQHPSKIDDNLRLTTRLLDVVTSRRNKWGRAIPDFVSVAHEIRRPG